MATLRNFALAAVLTMAGLPLLAQTVLTCSSNNGRRNYCPADTRGGVTLRRQLGGSACRLNYSWGFDQRGVWVDRGCRADFVLRRVGYGPGVPGRPGVGPVQRITCSSNNGRRVYCLADTRRGVSLIRRRSGVCRQNYSWGYDAKRIWVDRGCRADFQLGRAMVPTPR